MKVWHKYLVLLLIGGSFSLWRLVGKLPPEKNVKLTNAGSYRPILSLNILEGFEATATARSPSGYLDIIVITATPLPTASPSPSPKPTITPSPTPNSISSNELEDMFTKYSHNNSVDRDLLKSIAICESRLNPNARNGKYGGLYQFSENTWMTTRRAMNADTNLNLRFNPEESIRTAAFKISIAGTSAWPNCRK